jgi:hypothetical protein
MRQAPTAPSARKSSVPRNVPSEIVVFWRNYVRPRGLAAAVRVRTNGGTSIKVEDSIPRAPFRRRGRGWRITTTSHFLRRDHFPDETARRGVAHNDQKARGRTLYCVSAAEHGSHARGQVVAALSWHVDERKSAPILITNLAIRGDSPDARGLSLAAAAWTLAYLLEVAAQTGRPDEVGVEIDTQPNREDFRAIGFRAASTPVAYSSPYWAFRAPL